MTRTKITTAVVGVGYLGRFHVEQMLRIPDAEFIGIYDNNPDRLKEIATEFNVPPLGSLDEVAEKAEAISVVVPTKLHYIVAKKFMDDNRHVFVEKPMTYSLAHANELVAMAREKNLILQVGNIERLNPAVKAMMPYVDNPRFIEGHRLAQFTSRGSDVPVVLDLMIHDIDMVMAIVNSNVSEVHASGVSVLTDTVDIANARIEFENGAVANLTASRISQYSMRKMRIFQTSTYVMVDFLQRQTEIYRLVDADYEGPETVMSIPGDSAGPLKRIAYTKLESQQYNALHQELSNFVLSVAGKEKPVVDGASARDALAVAVRISEQIGSVIPE